MSRGAVSLAGDAMVSVSVICVCAMPRFVSAAISSVWGGDASWNVRTVRSAAIKLRASRCSMVWNAREKPRTPVSEPTPAATARITNRKRPEDARVSRHAIFAAVLYAFRLAMPHRFRCHRFVAHHEAVAECDHAVGMSGEGRVMRHQHQRGAFAPVEFE